MSWARRGRKRSKRCRCRSPSSSTGDTSSLGSRRRTTRRSSSLLRRVDWRYVSPSPPHGGPADERPGTAFRAACLQGVGRVPVLRNGDGDEGADWERPLPHCCRRTSPCVLSLSCLPTADPVLAALYSPPPPTSTSAPLSSPDDPPLSPTTEDMEIADVVRAAEEAEERRREMPVGEGEGPPRYEA